MYCPKADKTIRFQTSNFSVKQHVDEMKEGGWDKACLLTALESIPIPLLSLQTETYLTKAWNDAVAKVVETNDCFVGVAQIPHQDPNAAIAEAERAVNDLGFTAIEIQGNWAGKNIESRDWWPFFEAVERLDVPLMSHPSANSGTATFNRHLPAQETLQFLPSMMGGSMGFYITHQIAITGMIFSGLLDRHPNLKIAWLETDIGFVPGLMDWLDSAYNTILMYDTQGILANFYYHPENELHRLKKRPSQYFRDNFYYGMISHTDLQLRTILPFAVDKLGLGRNIMMESDFDHAEGSLDIARLVRNLREIDEETKERICGRNAAELLKVKWTPSAYATL